MKILAVNNDPDALRELLQALEEVFPKDELITFLNPLFALKYLSLTPTDTALIFLSILLRPTHSFDFAAAVRRKAPGTTMIFTTQTETSELRALIEQVWGAECMTLPVTAETLRHTTRFLYEPCLWEDCEGCRCDWCEERHDGKKLQAVNDM